MYICFGLLRAGSSSVRYVPLAVIGSVIIGVILIVFANRKIHENPYILVMNCGDGPSETKALALLGENVRRYVVKSKTVSASGIELTAELRLKDSSTDFVNRLNEIPGVGNVTLVSYNGEYMA